MAFHVEPWPGFKCCFVLKKDTETAVHEEDATAIADSTVTRTGIQIHHHHQGVQDVQGPVVVTIKRDGTAGQSASAQQKRTI